MKFADAKNNIQGKFSAANATSAILKFVKVASTFVQIVGFWCVLIVRKLAPSAACANVTLATAIVQAGD